MRNKVKISLVICTIVGLVACGGGGSNDELINSNGEEETSGCYQTVTYLRDKETDGEFETNVTIAYASDGGVSSVYYGDYTSTNTDYNVTYRYEDEKLYEDVFTDTESRDVHNVYEYNDDKNKVFVSYAYGDESPYRVERYTYNEDGNIKTYLTEYRKTSLKRVYTYDDNGYRIKRYTEHDENGINYSINELIKYTNDIYGNKIKEEIYRDLYEESDANEDTLYAVIFYTYDTNHHRITKTIPGSSVTTYTYDTKGNRLTEESDYDLDGEAEEKTTLSYDTNNNLISKSKDNNLTDGIIDSTFYLTWKKFSNCPPSPYSQYIWWN